MGIRNELLNNLNGNNNADTQEKLPWENESAGSTIKEGINFVNKNKASGNEKLLDDKSKLQRIDFSSNKTRLIAGIVVVLLMVCGWSVYNYFSSQKNVVVANTSGEEKAPTKITVHVGGEVKHPGVYQLDSTQRLMDAVNMAGGLTENADSDQVNLAKNLDDGEQIIIPSKSSATSSTGAASNDSGSSSSSSSSSSTSGKVNINTADATALQTLSGVGPSTAQKIIDYRNANGKFKTIDELKKVSGIGEKTFAKFADKICV